MICANGVARQVFVESPCEGTAGTLINCEQFQSFKLVLEYNVVPGSCQEDYMCRFEDSDLLSQCPVLPRQNLFDLNDRAIEWRSSVFIVVAT